MAEQIYYSVFTKKGLELLTEAIRNGTKLGITSMAFGDGGGSLPVPNENFTSMVREVHRTQLNSLAPDPNNANWLRADAIIASATGGFNIRELGLYAGNVLVAYSNYPATYKPNPADGTARIMTFRMILQIDNTANFDLVIDPDVVLATIQSLNETKQEIYENTLNTVDLLSDLSNLKHWNGRTVYVKNIGNFEYTDINGWKRLTLESPMIIKDTATTSWAKISSENVYDDKSDLFAELVASKKNIIVDTQIALNKTVVLKKEGQSLTGAPGGILLNGKDMLGGAMLNIKGNKISARKLIMDNPLMLKQATGLTQIAISIQAHDTTIQDTFFYRMLHSVAVQSDGEWFGSKIITNRAYECIGVGDDSGLGEDRGDAFTVWGAGAIVDGNWAFAKAGEDCRIAFHAEGLGVFSPPNPYKDSSCIFTNNIARGSFRRHFVFEGMKNSIFDSNISEGGATWWNLALIDCDDCTVSNTIIRHYRNSIGGATAWNAYNAAIAFALRNKNITLSNTTIIGENNFDDVSRFISFQESNLGAHENINFESFNAAQKGQSKYTGVFIASGGAEMTVSGASKIKAERIGESFGSFEFNFKGTNLDCDKGFTVQSNTSPSSILNYENCTFKDEMFYLNSAAKVSVKGGKNLSTTQSDDRCYFWRATEIKIQDFNFTAPTKLITEVGEVYGNDPKLLLERNINLTSDINYPSSTLSNASSNLNTFYKYKGRVITSGGNLYIAKDSIPASEWKAL